MLNWPHILDVNRQDQNGMSPVHYAIIQKNFEELQKLTNVPCVFVNLADKDNKMPLHYAIESNFIEAIALLLEKGADLHAKDKYGNSILHYVAAFGTTETIRLILKNKPNVVSNHMGLKPLDFAIHCNNFNFLYYANENLENPACRILPVNERRVKISAYLNFIKLFWEGLAENSPKKHYLTLDDKITFFTLNKIIDHCLLSTRTFLSSSIPQFWQPLYNKSKENELSLRKALNTMHRGVSEQLKVLQIAHLEYTSNYIQPIQVVINRFGNIPIPYNASTVHSWFFAFFQLNELGCLSHPIDAPPQEFLINPSLFLKNWGYTVVEEIEPYDLVVYGAQYENSFLARHMGIVDTSRKVISKFGTLPEVWCHNVEDIAWELGNNLLIFRKSIEKTPYGEFKCEVEHILQNDIPKQQQFNCVQAAFKNFKNKIFRQSMFGEEQLLWAKTLMQQNSLYRTNPEANCSVNVKNSI